MEYLDKAKTYPGFYWVDIDDLYKPGEVERRAVVEVTGTPPYQRIRCEPFAGTDRINFICRIPDAESIMAGPPIAMEAT